MVEPFVDPRRMLPGSAKLVARCDEAMPGMVISPDVPQQSAAIIVLAHLSHPEKPRPSGDENLMPRKQEREKLMREQDAASADVHIEVVQ